MTIIRAPQPPRSTEPLSDEERERDQRRFAQPRGSWPSYFVGGARRSIVAPHKFLPLVVELQKGIAEMFDAIGRVTFDGRWKEAAQLLLEAATLLRHPSFNFHKHEPEQPTRSAFEGPGRSWVRLRKGMARVAAKHVRRRR